MSDAARLALAAITGQPPTGVGEVAKLLGLQSLGAVSPVFSPRLPERSYAAVPPPAPPAADLASVVATHLVLSRILAHLAAREPDPAVWLGSEAYLVDGFVERLQNAVGEPLSEKTSGAVRDALASIFGAARAAGGHIP